MRDVAVKKLGKRIYAMSITPLRRHAVYDGTCFGFDTEYDAKTKKLLSLQLYYIDGKGKGKGVFVPCRKMTPDVIAREAVKLCGFIPDRMLLVTWFSLAELQHLDVKGSAFMVREFARGSLDVTFITRKYQGIELEVFDMARWYDFVSLKKAADSIGEKKLDFAREKMSWKILNTRKGREYAVHDAFLCLRLFNELREKFAGRNVDIVSARTPASASASVFRIHHVGEEEEFYCDKNRARWAAVMGTWGGRAEVFRRGRLKGTYYEKDIVSAYPNASISIGIFPCQGSWHRCTDLGCCRSDAGGFCHARFRFGRSSNFPCLPVSTTDGSIIYPLEGETWATSFEVSLARKLGAEIRLVEGWGFDRGVTNLSDYMKECLESRKDAKGAARTMWKLLANSIIGKFAQRTDRVQVSKLYELANKTGLLIDELVEMSHAELALLAEEEKIKLERFSLGSVWMPEWNGLITGFTRARLSEQLAASGGIYCHTDSLWTDRDFEKPGWDTKGKGKATVVRTRFAALWDKKEPHIAHHSVWTRLVAEQMLRKFKGDDFARKYPKSRPLKFREAVKRGDVVGRWIEEDDAGFWHRADTRWDGKRFLFPDGSTRPWKNLLEYEAWKEADKLTK